MPSPFPGMDPFVENQEWEDFHSRFNSVLAELLSPAIEPDYFVRVRRHKTYSVIRHRETMDVVTVIELLSLSNKCANGTGRREYLAKREELLASSSHLVEIDLIRGGERLPMAESLPNAEYYAVISRANRRPVASVYGWTVRQTLPTIPIPLRLGDEDSYVDLQAAFAIVYDRARYNLSVNYHETLEPEPDSELSLWLREVIQSRSTT